MFARIRIVGVLLVLILLCCDRQASWANDDNPLRVGFGKRDITPQAPTPMWGYGARHALLSQGTLTPLYAKAIVVQSEEGKVAMVGLDIGRGPTRQMMEKIRAEILEKAGIENVLISGSHSHHGPVIELIDREGFGKGTYDDAVAYAEKLPDLIIEAILEADKTAQPATIGVGTRELTLNRNRHTKRNPKARDPLLSVVRFDDAQSGKPLAVLVNFAAHPVMTKGEVLKFSADYPGFMQDKVEAEMETNCVFIQGAAGDLSPNPTDDFREPKLFGEELARNVIEVAGEIESKPLKRNTIVGRVDQFRFKSRIDFSDPLVLVGYSAAFFPELIVNFIEEAKEGHQAELNTVLLGRQIALVGGSGEFFCNHAVRLRERSYVDHTLFFGYCNGHNLYFPTIEAVSEGGYGADAAVSPVEIGAGERMMNRALINIYEMAGRMNAQAK
ncbi:Neutral ceramidase precursor [Symmachiella dynata]|uniref:neutral/alkaline non-lysosomal ceramidase N-terminal domain-containing protein n=1 Tax=Symmachiella dynata TaxID=2527995 RepID=UPI00118882F3|nr:neutral/alkaline non-lysosomal ceramidase N-terminal domain-containing protein [Symmachiella dynata]QDT48574.1 Neutral ceramidase precursor [Symmachiella dynata]